MRKLSCTSPSSECLSGLCSVNSISSAKSFILNCPQQAGFKWSLTLALAAFRAGTCRMLYSELALPCGPHEKPIKSNVTNQTRKITAVQRWSTVKRISDYSTIKNLTIRWQGIIIFLGHNSELHYELTRAE